MVDHRDTQFIDWYALLEVRPDASTGEIDAAYRRLARTLHPDSAHPRAVDVERLQLVVEAHDILSNPARRRAYNARRIVHQRIGASRELRHCPVCRGTRMIATPCRECGASGYQSSASPWLRATSRCRSCRGTGHRLTPCGACAATGYTTHADRTNR